LSGHLKEVKDVAFSPDGRVLASGSWDNTIKLWDTSTWKELRTLEDYHYRLGMVTSISFSPDGRLIAATSRNDGVGIWEVVSGAQKVVVKHTNVLAVAFDTEGIRLVTAGEQGVVKVWDASSGTELFDLKGHTDDVISLGFSGGGNLLASGSADGTIKLWDLRTGSEIRTLKGHERPVIYVGFSGEQELVSESNEDVINVFDATTRRKLQTLRGFGYGWAASLSPDNKTLAVEVPSEGFKLLDAVSAQQLLEIKWKEQDEHREIDEPHEYRDRLLWAFGNDQLAIAFLSKRKVESKNELGKRMTEAYTIKIWKLGGGGVRQTYSREIGDIRPDGLSFSPDGKWLIVSGSTILLWSTEDRKTLLDFDRGSYAESLDISHDDALLAAGDTDGAIRLWDVTAGRVVGVLRGHASRITGLEFHPEKNVLMSQSSDGIFKFWDTKAGQELATLIPLDDTDWVVVTPDGRFDASPNAMKLMHYVYGLEVITLEQLKDAYYEPGLLAKLIGSSKEPLRTIRPLRSVKLYPEVVGQEVQPDGTTLSVTLKNRGGGIGPVRIAVNGKTVTEDARDDKLRTNQFADTATLRFDLRGSAFVAGQANQITVTTSNYDPQTNTGYINSRGATIVFTPKGEKRPEPPRLFAIIGGISDYAGDSLDLRFAAKDAEDFATALRAGAKSLFGADKVNITVLSTTGREGTVWPSKRNFIDAFAEVAKKARPEDVLVIYLAGHGVSASLNTDSYYYLTQEAQSASKESLSNPDVREETAISSTELTNWLTKTEWVKGEKGVKPLKQVMILDTCAAGTMAGQVSLMTRRDLSGNQIRAIERLKDRTGFHILMGSAADAVSYEATQYGQGLLTYALLQAMRGAKLREGEFADVSEIFQYAADEVPRLARDIGGIQKPIVAAPLGTSFDIGRFGKDEQSQVPLGRVKPLVLRPRLINPEQGFDELELEDSLRKSLLESSYAAARGPGGRATSYVFIDADEMPGALRPSGTYVVRGDAVTVTLNLIRDGKKVKSFQVTGDKADVNALAYKLTSSVAEAINGLP
jgi:WD40 repeat protein